MNVFWDILNSVVQFRHVDAYNLSLKLNRYTTHTGDFIIVMKTCEPHILEELIIGKCFTLCPEIPEQPSPCFIVAV